MTTPPSAAVPPKKGKMPIWAIILIIAIIVAMVCPCSCVSLLLFRSKITGWFNDQSTTLEHDGN